MTEEANVVTGSGVIDALNVARSPEKKEAQTRPYKVLLALEQDTFQEVGEYVASNDKAAIKEAVDLHGFGTYVAVAAKSWHKHTRTSEKVERVRWS